MYDAIVVGARCAGSSTAMLLARDGFKVLLVDKATFPSDTISTHILWPHGAEILDRWGLLDRLAATSVPPICRRMSFDVGPFALHGTVPGANQGRGGYCPRRTVLDHLLVRAASEAGVEVREAFVVEGLLRGGDRVTGIRGHARGGTTVEEHGRVVIGADGVNSFVARTVGAREYDQRGIAACGYYSYFSGVPGDDIELYVREGVAFGGVPTHDGLHLVMINWPAAQFPAVRADIERHVWNALAHAPDFLARVRSGRRELPWYGTAGVPQYFRKPYGDGWALAGDAGYNRDPITAQGMTDAFIDAGLLSSALGASFSGSARFEALFSAHEASRNERVRPMYEFAGELALLHPPPPAMQMLFGALRDDQDATNAFFSAITGATPIGQFMSPANLERIVGTQRSH
jgi:2-polyprenyl-6-methoxyphenol hydroxylase-like FAD-dependent oxidoreductase